MACIIKSLEFATNAIQNVPNVNDMELTNVFMTRARELAANVDPSAFIIDLEIFEMAKLFVEKAVISKLILSSYKIDPIGSLEDAYNKICSMHIKITGSISPQFQVMDKVIFSLMKRVFTVKPTRMTASLVNQGNCSAQLTKTAFKNLEDLGLGRISNETSGHNNCDFFIRITYDQFIDNESHGRHLASMGLDLKKVSKLLLEAKKIEEEEKFKGDKRLLRVDPEDENNEPDVKKQKISASASNLIVKTRSDNCMPYEVKNNSSIKKQVFTNTTSKHVNKVSSKDIPTTSNKISEQVLNNSDASSSSFCDDELDEQISIGPNERLTNTKLSQSQNDQLNIAPNQNDIQTNTTVQYRLTDSTNNLTNELNSLNQTDNLNNANNNITIETSLEAASNDPEPSTSKQSNGSGKKNKQTPPDIIIETVDNKTNYYKIVDGQKKKCSQYGNLFGPKKSKEKNNNLNVNVSQIMTRRSSRELLENETSASQPANTEVVSRNINAVKFRNHNPLAQSTQRKEDVPPTSPNGWDA